MIKIRPYQHQPIEDASYLRVYTYPKPSDPTIRLANVEWVQSGPRKLIIEKVMEGQALSHEDAVRYAKRFAEENRVPVVYQKKASGS